MSALTEEPNIAADPEREAAIAKIAEVLQDHSTLENWRECSCGKWRAWTSDGPSGCYEEHAAAAIAAALGEENGQL